MAFDGVFLRHIRKELEQKLLNTKVDKVHQPSRDQIILTLRSREGAFRLLLSAHANSPRIHLTSVSPENPKVPPMLCMLLRKKLSGARLRRIEQPSLERVLLLDFEAVNELGDPVLLRLSMEIMGQYSNIILIDDKGMIIDAVKRVDASMSSQRLVMPGLPYELPPAQSKLSMLETDVDTILSAVTAVSRPMPLSKALLQVLQGVSPILCREYEYLCGHGREVRTDELDEEKLSRLRYFLKRDMETARSISGQPYMIIDHAKKPIDFTFTYIQQYGTGHSVSGGESFGEMLDRYYAKRDSAEAMRVKSEDLTKLLSNTASRLLRKIYIQTDELKQCADREHLRVCGELIQANLYRLERGASSLEAENYYLDPPAPITISLDPALSPAANAQRYFKNYQKAKTAEQMLTLQISAAEEELDYVSSVLDAVSRAQSEGELDEIREELIGQGYLKARGRKQRRPSPLKPLCFTSAAGFLIYVGRNNRQNDQLTLHTADKNDIWLHVKDIPGSHTLIVTQGKTPDEDTLLLAARLAAGHSKARESGKVPVDYTKARYVSKPTGAKPGKVIYTHQQTLYVAPLETPPGP